MHTFDLHLLNFPRRNAAIGASSVATGIGYSSILANSCSYHVKIDARSALPAGAAPAASGTSPRSEVQMPSRDALCSTHFRVTCN